jgi:ArsR family transcriptional regulator, arsenate/arsenite/antimonite-responsive transcriptional repressor
VNIDHTELFATLSNETRLRCLYLAARHREVCVCEVVDTLGIAQPTASKALNALKAAGLVKDRRDANWIYYRLNESMPMWIEAIVDATVDQLARSKTYLADEKRFRKARARSAEVC